MIIITDKINNSNKEIVSLAFNLKDGNYIENIFYELETNNAVMFGRNIDDKILFIPKSVIKGGWTKYKMKAQNINLKSGIGLYWKPRKP